MVGGLIGAGAEVDIFSGSELELQAHSKTRVHALRKWFLFAESLQLSYNFRFSQQVMRVMSGRRPLCVYQRHGRWVYAGVLLAARLRVPLVLEYNGSEVWMAAHWHPARFVPLLRLCEKAAINNASWLIVVSEPLKQELIQQGLPAERVLVIPNGVDPNEFRPGERGDARRQRWGFNGRHVVIGFLGTFSYWHGVKVLQEAMSALLAESEWSQLRFLLIGDGTLCQEMKRDLAPYIESGQILFTGSIPHDDVPSALDAADILVSPHVPMPDGRPFFGSPTKLFEYMAMGKAIVASRLDQIAEVLEHDKTAWLTTPGDAVELAAGIKKLAGDEALRQRLGTAARLSAIQRYTWRQNAERILQGLRNTGADTRLHAEPLVAAETIERQPQ
jgi:glycosyltransferase involved in cell wall biosynthesis